MSHGKSPASVHRPLLLTLLLALAACPSGVTGAAAGESAGNAGGAGGREEHPEREEHRNLADALREGVLSFSLRYRWERVSDDAPATRGTDASASTLRSAFTYSSARFHRFSLVAGAENVANLGADDRHNDTRNGVGSRPVIADPPGTEVQQAFIRRTWKGDAAEVRLGRTELDLGEQRFVGKVGWRMNHQSFDALSARVSRIPRTTLHYAYVDNVNNITGRDLEMSSHLVLAEVRARGGTGRASVYVYDLDYDGPATAPLSTTTLGVRWKDAHPVGEAWTLSYHAETARQTDAGDNPAQVDARYARLEIGGRRKHGLWLKAGWERLGGRPGAGSFSTPLATLHKWNGWADKFLATPATGLRDTHVGAGKSWGAWSAMVVHHDFRADGGGTSHGDETDAQVSFKARWGQTFAVKVALYRADTFAADTDKLWFWTAWSF